MPKLLSLFLLLVSPVVCWTQLPVARDTIAVLENGYVLKMPWGNGINYANVSSVDLNLDGKKDLVVFDRMNLYSEGRFRCFINVGTSGNSVYRADTYMSYRFPRAFNWAVFMDYDGDGKEDLFTSGNNNIAVYRNISSLQTPNATPTFSLVKPIVRANIGTTTTPLYSPLFVSIVGVPGISDIDNDGDLDILSFSSQGTFVEYYKNLSQEKYGHSDSLDYKYTDPCWGKVAESNCAVDFSLCAGKAPVFASKSLHAGSCLTCLDSDNDGDKDLLMGDIACNKLQYVHNSGSPTNAFFNDTTKVYPNYKNNNTVPVRLNNFPCPYILDVDGDGKKDMVVSPNSAAGANYTSMWYYKNTSATGTVNFTYVKNNLLQDEMIEVGQNSYPVLFDYDNDGKKDLLIGSHGYYLNNVLNPRLTLYKNTGTASQPSYSLVSRDYASLSTQNGVYYAMPAIGDIDGDGDADMCLGTSSGQIHWLENTAGAGNVCNFSVFKNNPFQFTTPSAVAAPQLFDLDGDGLLDLLIGMKNGRIAYYRNTGTLAGPAFSLVTPTLGAVSVTDDPTIFGFDGYAAPFFYRESGVVKLLVGSVTGKIFQYQVPANPLDPFVLVSGFVNGLYEGGQSTVWYEDINNDGKRDLFVGNASGGLSYFSSNSPYLALADKQHLGFQLKVYPNPATNTVHVLLEGVDATKTVVTVTDICGREVFKTETATEFVTLNVAHFERGIYFVTAIATRNGVAHATTAKLIKD